MSPALVSPAAAAVGTAALTVSGCVWYVPALVDLRAGADRPASRRLAAAACLTGWATALAVALLLLAGGPWRAAGAAVALGGSAAVTLRVRAALRRRREAAEEALRWAALLRDPAAAAARTRTPTPTRTFARWTAGGLAAATTVAAATLPVPGGGWWGAAAAGGTVTAGFLAVGAVRARRR